MNDFDNFKNKMSKENDLFLNDCLSKLENEFKQFEIQSFSKGKSNFVLSETIIKELNERLLLVLESYHDWLLDNFDIVSK